MLRLTVSHDQEQTRRLDGSGAWYERVRADYKGAKWWTPAKWKSWRAAKEAVLETFLTLAMDISNPISVQGQFAFLRNLHYAFATSVLGALVSGGIYVFWAVFKASAAAPPASVVR
jgi:hypothetical protein